MELVSIIVPVHNERATLATCVERLLAVDLGAPREVVVADDGSTDGCADVVRRIGESHDSVRGVFLPRRRGKGAAVAAGLAAARGTIAVIHDADLEYDAADLPRVLDPILAGKADAVYGSRFAPGQQRRVLYYRHAIGNRLVTALSNLFTDLNVTDVETGCKAFRMDLVQRLPIRSRTFTFEIEITAKLAALGARIYEVPISYHGRSYLEGKKISWIDGIRAVGAVLRFAAFADLGSARPATLARLAHRRLRRQHARIGRLARAGSGDRVVELSAGLGTTTVHLVGKERLVCVEGDPDRAGFLRRQFEHRPNVRVVEGDPRDASVADELRREAPDSVLGVGALASAEDVAGLLRSCAAVLGPGGRLFVCEPSMPGLFAPLDRALGRRRRFGRRELVDAIEAAGFAVECARTVNRAGTLAWLVWAKILRRRSATGLLAGALDRLSVLWRVLDYVLPVPGLSLLITARRSADHAPRSASGT